MKFPTRIYMVFILTFFLTAGSNSFAEDETARKIMEKVNRRDDGDNQTADMKMILIDKNGNRRVRQIKVFSKDKGEDKHMLMFFYHPSDVKDTGFLTHDFDEPSKDDNQWLYMPALKKTKRIASRDKSGRFMGSDMNYSDMTKRQLDDYDFKFYEKAKQKQVKGNSTWVIWCHPRTSKIAKETGYDKTLVFVRQDNFIVTRMLAFEQGSKYLKFFDIEKLEKIDGIWVATKVSITRKKGKELAHKTIFFMENVRFNQKLDDDLFTIRKMEKGL